MQGVFLLAILLTFCLVLGGRGASQSGHLLLTNAVEDPVKVIVESEGSEPIVLLLEEVNDTRSCDLPVKTKDAVKCNISAVSMKTGNTSNLIGVLLKEDAVHIVLVVSGKNNSAIQLVDSQTIQLLNNSRKPSLSVDKAVLLVINNSTSPNFNFFVNGTYDDCYGCLPWQLDGDAGRVNAGTAEYLTLNTQFGLTLDPFMAGRNRSSRRYPSKKFQTDKTGHYNFQEKAEYMLLCFDISPSSASSDVHINCIFRKTKDGVNTYAPLAWAAIAIGLFAVTVATLLFLNRRYHLLLRMQCRTHDRLVNADLGSTERFSRSGTFFPNASPDQATEAASPLQRNSSPTEDRGRKRTTTRLRSLDAFRGISLTIMIFVNYEGGRYWFFNHSRWNGLTVADCVFPWFMWIMGTSMVMSMKGQRRRNMSKVSMLTKVIRRSVILFGLGLFLNNGYDLGHWRIPGVLQRFGISYLIVGIAEIVLPTVLLPPGHILSPLQDIICYPFHWLFMLLLLVIHTAITFGLSVPGCPTGYIGPGGIGDNFKYPNCTGGAAGYIDKKLFGRDHIYRHPTCTDVYHCEPYDPEGALGSLTSIFLVFLGVQAGRILVLYERGVPHVARWMIWGSALGAIGTGLCGAAQDTGVIPINKNLWSLSFIFVLGAGAFILLAFCYVVCDVIYIWNGAPFFYPGMNSILVYCGSELLEGYFPFSFKVSSSHGGILANSIIGSSCWILVAFYLYKIKFFVKI